jgi:hypothetical protein
MSIWVLGAWTVVGLAFVTYTFRRSLLAWLASPVNWFFALAAAVFVASMVYLFIVESLPRIIISATVTVMVLLTTWIRRQRGAAA